MATRPARSRRRAAKTRKPQRSPARSGTAGTRIPKRSSTSWCGLRGPNGCPWDREQTIQSLRGFVLEETYEVLDAIDRRDHDALDGEIGDLLFEGVFLAQVEADEGRFSVADSLRAISRKADPPPSAHLRFDRVACRTRRPGGRTVGADQGARTEGCRRAAIAAARRAQRRCRRCCARTKSARVSRPSGSIGQSTADVVDKIEEEVRRADAAPSTREGRQRAEEEMGDLLFSIANLARKLGIEPSRRCVRQTPNSARDSKHSSVRSMRRVARFTMPRCRRNGGGVGKGEESAGPRPSERADG